MSDSPTATLWVPSPLEQSLLLVNVWRSFRLYNAGRTHNVGAISSLLAALIGADPRHSRTVVDVLEDDADRVTGDDREGSMYRVELETEETADFRWRDLRPPLNQNGDHPDSPG